MSERPRVVAIVQARMGSTRLPGKVLKVLGARSVLEWVVRAARSSESIDDVVIATSREPEDDAIDVAARAMGCRVVRGSTDDVLSRFVLAAEVTGADAVVRLTADCPLLDPALIDHVVDVWRREPELGYVSTVLTRTLPRGMDVELVSRAALAWADAHAAGYDRVHVTSLLYRQDSKVPRLGIMVAPSRADLRVTLDVADDLALLEALVALLPDAAPSWRLVASTLDARPDIVALNASVTQKQLEEG